jgi:hypothetical protein
MKKTLILLLAIMSTSISYSQTKQKVAVYVTGAEEGINEFMGAYLVDAIVHSSNYLAVERTADFLRELNKEQSYQLSGAVDDDQISQLGKQFGVQFVCVAKVGKIGEKQFVSARLIDVETATVKSSTKPVLFTTEDIDKSCAAVAISLISGEPIDIKRPAVIETTPAEQPKPTVTSSPQNANNASLNIQVSAYTGCGFEIMATDLPGRYRWTTAMRACPQGWRLPTAKELECLCNDKSVIGGFYGKQYWSSDKRSEKRSISRTMNDCETEIEDIEDEYSCRCVRNIR